ncbi:MAG: TRAFs-binding domain-containing protein [Verrucomicrobiota bacterium]|jgi:class 3 adenylate cyclase
MVKQAVSTGQLLLAIETARAGLAAFGESLVLRQQLALALAQTGVLDVARQVLAELIRTTGKQEETLCLLGRVYKEIWRRSTRPAEAAQALRHAQELYSEAYALYHTCYPGINLAFTLAMGGQRVEAEKCARAVADLCRGRLAKAGATGDGWLLATLAEAMTHLGEMQAAGETYRRAAALFAGKWRDLSSMRHQAREILQSRGDEPRALDGCFALPSVVVFAGHMLDRPGRSQPRFPAHREAEVRRQISQYLDEVKVGFGYCSAACGGDILFCECMLERGAELHLVLACPVEAFKRQSVNFAGEGWARRFDNIIAKATSCSIANPAEVAASESAPLSPVTFVYANRIITGLAVVRAQALDLQLNTLAVWDGSPGDGLAGTSSVVAEWMEARRYPYVIAPSPPEHTSLAGTWSNLPEAPVPFSRFWGLNISAMQQDIKAVLFADVVGYSGIGEDQMRPFVTQFMGAVARLIADSKFVPIIAQTWGDALYFAFDGVRDAALFALDLRDLVVHTPWADHGLPAELGLRIALHAGPVFICVNPVMRQVLLTGSHVTRAARLEPVTAKGQVYVSQEFAALCGAEGVSEVAFEYLGHLPIPKDYGAAPLYRLERSREV